jgi:hypothetical protein
MPKVLSQIVEGRFDHGEMTERTQLSYFQKRRYRCENAVKAQTWIAVSVYVLVVIVRARLDDRKEPGCFRLMFMIGTSVYIGAILGAEDWMGTTRPRSHKHFQLDARKIKRAQRVLRADTETEAIERALDIVIAEHERNRLTVEANDRFIRSGIDINDAYGTLEK